MICTPFYSTWRITKWKLTLPRYTNYFSGNNLYITCKLSFLTELRICHESCDLPVLNLVTTWWTQPASSLQFKFWPLHTQCVKHYWSIVDLNIFDSRNLKTMCFYMKFISCLLLIRNFENQTVYVLKRHPIFSVHPVSSEHFWSLKLSKLLFGGSEHLTIPNSQN